MEVKRSNIIGKIVLVALGMSLLFNILMITLSVKGNYTCFSFLNFRNQYFKCKDVIFVISVLLLVFSFLYRKKSNRILYCSLLNIILYVFIFKYVMLP